MDLSIIIVNWHSKEYLRACLASIRRHTRTLTYEIIVIDSASFDGCETLLRDEHPDVRFIQSPTNLGFARANNRAAADARGTCVLFLNPDTEVVGPAIEILYEALTRRPEAGIVGGTLLNGDRTLQVSCVQSIPTLLNQLLDSEFLRTRCPRSRLWGAAPLYQVGRDAREVEAISGACLMMRRKTFEELCGFSEEYFMYAEDIDLAHRAREAGYRNYYVPDAIVIHYGGGSSGHASSAFSAVMLREAICRFMAKTHGPAYALAYRIGMGATAIGRLCVLGALRVAGRRDLAIRVSRRKWQAVLQWSLNRAEAVRTAIDTVTTRGRPPGALAHAAGSAVTLPRPTKAVHP